MLPLAHVYISTRVTGQRSPLLILGSILPDICTTSEQQIGREQIHNSPKEFSEFIDKNYPVLADLGLGVRLHSHVGGGADFYSDDLEVGYAKLEGAKISRDVAHLLEIPDGDISLVLSHNFIEMAVDLHLYQNQRETWNMYNEGIERVKTELPKVSECMGNYLKLEYPLILEELHNLIDFLNPYNLVSKEIAIEKIALPLIKLRFHKDISKEKTLKIAGKALDITESTYSTFLNNTVVQVKRNILGA